MAERKCDCGWLIPLSVFAYKNKTEPTEDNNIKDVFVALICPICNAGHTFIDGRDN